jgi:HTH-type transcriptional regulator/antitoxin HigA
MNIKPIKNERDYRRALAEVESLMDAKANTPDGDRLDILATLVEAWEADHHPIDAPDPIAAIQFAMEQRGVDRKGLESMIGSRSGVAAVMGRRRALTLPMIRKLHQQLGIPAHVLIQE